MCTARTATCVPTVEVAVSKIFPAGFGWQYASCVADGHFGFAGDSAGFALCTGVGDVLGVFLGHTLYMLGKKGFVSPEINATHEAQTGWFLGTAAFCSGRMWQPTVNVFTASGMNFTQVACATTIMCGASFFTGLRLGRMLYSRIFDGIAHKNYSNLQADGLLSLSVGGATGAFVGTDTAQLGNWLAPYFGVPEGTPDLVGAAIAGSSTGAGFIALQTAENLFIVDGKNWVD